MLELHNLSIRYVTRSQFQITEDTCGISCLSTQVKHNVPICRNTYLRNSRAHTTCVDSATTNRSKSGRDFAKSSDKRAAKGKPWVHMNCPVRPRVT